MAFRRRSAERGERGGERLDSLGLQGGGGDGILFSFLILFFALTVISFLVRIETSGLPTSA